MVANTITGRVGDSLSTLLLAPTDDARGDEMCIDLLTTSLPEETNVLSVTLTQSPSARVDLWRRRVGETLPRNATIVSSPTASGDGDGDVPASVDVDRLPEDAELPDVGMAIARHVGRWSTTDGPTVLCLHSLSALLSEFERDHVIGFVNALNGLCDHEGVIAHHHLDPTAHGEDTLASFRPLYDVVLEHVSDHGWTVWEAGDAAAPTFRGSTVPPGGDHAPTPGPLSTVPMPYSFDTVLDLIAAARRRTLLYALKDSQSSSLTLDALVDAVSERESSIPKRTPPDSREEVRMALRHVHLPKLDEVGIVDYDPEAATVRYHRNEALEACLQYVETLELG